MARRLDPSDLEKAACSGDVEEVRKLLDVSNTNQSKSKGHPRDKNGSTALHLAVSQNHEVAIRTLISAGANINLPDSTLRMSPLMYAVYLDRVSCVCELLKLGADINWVNGDGVNALILAAKCGHEKCLKLLIKAGADIKCVDSDGRNAFWWAAACSHEQCLHHLCEADASDWLNQGLTALMYAAHIHSLSCLRRLLKAGADVNVKATDGLTALHFTARSKDPGEFMKVLLESGADCNATTSSGETALMALTNKYCCHPRSITPHLKTEILKCVKLLIKSGTDANKINGEGKTVLMQIVRKDCLVQALPVLVKAGAVVDQQDFSGMTALAHASSMKSHACVRWLLDAGASVNICDHSGKTSLSHAAISGSHKCVRCLLAAGAFVNICDLSGKSPLSYAAITGNPECVRLLLVYFANIRDCSGKTPFHYLVSSAKWHWDVEKCLEILRSEDLDLDVNSRDNDGMTPLMCVAKLHDGYENMKILFQHGADINLVDNLGQTALFHCLQSFLDPLNSLTSSNLTRNIKFLLSVGAYSRGGKLKVGNLFRLTQINYDVDLEMGSEVALNVPWNNFVSVIKKGMRKILQFLIINKVMPPLPKFIIDKVKPSSRPDISMDGNSLNYYSPLSQNMPERFPSLPEYSESLLENALIFGRIGITKYLIATCYLSCNDLKFCSGRYPTHPVESNNLEVVTLMQSLRRQPWPLVKLCFVAVSTAYAASPGRQERIKNSQLPPKLQKMLLFQEPWSRLCVHQWDDIPLTFNSVKYEKLPRPRPLLYHWPVGRVLIPCDCGECDGTMYTYELDEGN